MNHAEQIARAFIETRREAMAPAHRLDAWDDLPEAARWITVEVFELLLRNRVIAVPERVTRRDVLASPHDVAKDTREIDQLIGGLDALYGRAHEDVFAQGGAGEVSGRGSLAGVDPTGDQVVDRRRERDRSELRLAGTRIREARNALYLVRKWLIERATTGAQQVKRADQKALIPQADLDASLQARERRAASGE